MTHNENDSSSYGISPAYRELLLAVFEPRLLDEVARVVVDDLFAVCDARRVTLTLRLAGSSRVAAISGLVDIKQHSKLVQSLQQICQVAIRHGDRIVFGVGDTTVPDSVVADLSAFLNTTGAVCGILVPLRADGAQQQPVGCLAVEFDDPQHAQSAAAELEKVTPLIALAVANAVRLNSILFEPTRHRAGRLLKAISATRIRKLVMVAVSFGLAITTMSFVEVPYIIRAEGIALPVSRQRVFAPSEGNVTDIHVSDGDVVNFGTPLVKIESHKLAIEKLIAENEVGAKKKLVATLRTHVGEAANRGSRADAARAESELARENIAMKAAERRLAQISRELGRLDVKSPSDGTVVMFDVQGKLNGRPVNRGELLMEVMDTSAAWELELRIPESRVGHFQEAVSQSSNELTITFVSSGNPDITESAKLVRLGNQTLTDIDSGSYLPVVAEINTAQKRPRVVGAEISARITGVQCTLLYYLFGDVYEAARRRWF